ncbi:MAG: exodeoxyribonuclease VII large subunit [Jiangellales bacterium]
MALDTSAENPIPVRVVSTHIGAWIHRLGTVWVEGQVTQLSRRPGARTVFLTLRDPSATVSLQITCSADVVAATTPPLVEGARVVVRGRPNWYYERGTLSLAVDDIRPVGVGALLARVDQVRRLLAAEGIFAVELKRRLPFVPAGVGLICGRASAAEHDVLENARLRAAGIAFRVENVPVQGAAAVPEVIAALQRLEADPRIEVIIVARGGGSVEDLLPFSDEALVRAVATCTTPVVSAIGHETDAPLLDLVADVRASTPTDAAKRVVPDVADEKRRVHEAQHRLSRRVRALLEQEHVRVQGMLARPGLADPGTVLIKPRRVQVAQSRRDAMRDVANVLRHERARVDHARAQVSALSPAATLARGYAVVQGESGAVVRSPDDVRPRERLRLRLAHGEVAAVAEDGPEGSITRGETDPPPSA